MGTALLGGAALVGGALLARNPSLLGRGAHALNSIRQQLMLSGMAIPKAVLGNIGGAAVASADRRSLAPLREFLSTRTLKDVVRQYRAGAPGHVRAATATGKAIHGPGRVLGAIDEAAQAAFGRAGVSPEDAARLTFQTPLGQRFGSFGEALDSPAARYILPFRRTPFNVFYEGLETVKPQNLKTGVQRAMLGTAAAAGAAHGGATADERFPMSLGLGAALSNRYALPYLLAASGGRALAGGRDPEGLAAEALPVSEYGLASGVTDPLRAFTQPAYLRVLRRLAGAQ